MAQRKTNYYVPLTTLRQHIQPHFSPHALPLWTHAHFHETLNQIQNTSSAKSQEKIGKAAGLRVRELNMPLQHQFNTINLVRSYPWEWMHLFLENIIPTLVKHWMGKFKGLGPGKEDYEIEPYLGSDWWWDCRCNSYYTFCPHTSIGKHSRKSILLHSQVMGILVCPSCSCTSSWAIQEGEVLWVYMQSYHNHENYPSILYSSPAPQRLAKCHHRLGGPLWVVRTFSNIPTFLPIRQWHGYG